VATRTPFVIEKRYVRPDGSFVWVENSVSRIDDVRGRPRGVAAVSIDITQRKQDELALRESRERFRWIFESAEVSIWEEDFSRVKPRLDELKREHGAGLRAFLEANPALVVELGSLMQIRDVNPATLTMFGAADKETLYSSLDAISLPETIGVFLDELMAIAEDKRRFSSEAALRTLDGKPLHVLCTTTYPDADGSYENALVTLTDISMRKLAEQEREARVAEMERAVRFSERFVGILGHDLRNPLNAIATSVTLLSPHSEPDKFARTVRSIVRTAARMDRMIAQLLDFTRIRLGGGLPLLREPVDLLEVTRQVTEELESAVHLEIPVSTIGDVTGTWDRDRLSQLVSNLAANAIEHGVRGTVEILIDGTDRSAVQLEVSNGGVIAVEKLPGLFDPLRNAGDRKKNSMSSRGLGLGLYITKEITVAHGGSIHVDSAEPHGTRVVVELPRIEGAQTERVFA